MFVHQLEAAISGAPVASLQNLSGTIWKALAAGQITEADADRLSMALEARREAFSAKGGRNPSSPSTSRPRASTGPQRAAAIERRRRQASSGELPPGIATHFTMGEAAVLAVMAREIRRCGSCTFVMDKIAALAGVCRTTARNALRRAQQLGLIRITERRVRWWRNLPNIVTMLSPDWRRWLRMPRSRGWAQKSGTLEYQDVDGAANPTGVAHLFSLCAYKPSFQGVHADMAFP